MTPPNQLGHTFAQLQRMYEALGDLRREAYHRDPKLFALIAEGTVAQIKDLQHQIEVASGVEQVWEAETDLWLKAEGREVSWPDTRSSVLTSLLDSLRKGIQNVAEHLLGLGAAGGRPLERLKQACDLEVVALQPGSLVVRLRIPSYAGDGLQVDLARIRQALSDYLRAVGWAASTESVDNLDAEFTDEPYRKLLLAEVKRLAPRKKGDVESVHLFGRSLSGGGSVKLTRQAAKRIEDAIYRDSANPPQEHEGRVREVDLDSRSFTLRKMDEVEEVRCAYSDEFQETVKEALGRSVKIAGVRRSERGRLSSVLEISRFSMIEMNQHSGHLKITEDVSPLYPERKNCPLPAFFSLRLPLRFSYPF